MARDRGPFKLSNPWLTISWSFAIGLLVVGSALGFIVLGRAQQNGPALGTWTAICRALGITSDVGPARAPQPPLRTPSPVAWTNTTLAQVAGGNPEHGAFVAVNCTACHGEQGVSQAGLYPTLAGMDAAVIYKQLDDFRVAKRSWGVMNAIAQALSAQDAADVGAYFAGLNNGLPPLSASVFSPGIPFVKTTPPFAWFLPGILPAGIPPCAACYGPGDHKIGAPQLKTQQPAYIGRQLAAFAQGFRQNDINEQMRTIAKQLTPDEMRVVAEF